MKKLGEILCIPAILLAGNCFSQQVIATAGSSGSGTGIELSWTIGEPVTATTHGSDFYLTQGFHQSNPMTAMYSQELSLSAGWNIMSARVIPGNKNMMDVFQLLINSGVLKKIMDESGKVVEDWGLFGGWQNTIGSLKSTEGYKVNVKANTTHSIGGTTLLFPFYISLTAGWNIISWPSPNEQGGMEVFQSLIDEGKLKKVMDESGKVIENWGVFGGWQNTIDNLKPGEGYKVNVTTDCILTINETGTKSEEIIPELVASTYFIPAFKGNGTDHMNINLVNLAESGIRYGDEIGIFDGDICVGSAKFSIQNSAFDIRNSIGIPVSATDGIEGKNGYTEGNQITLKIFRNGKEYPLTIQPLNQSKTVFEKGSSLFAQVDLATDVEGFSVSAVSEINVYPNPFSEELNIIAFIPGKEKIEIEVYDVLGRKVRELYRGNNQGKLTLTWDGTNDNGQKVITGIYTLRVNEFKFKAIRK
jgi:hypothetical protein